MEQLWIRKNHMLMHGKIFLSSKGLDLPIEEFDKFVGIDDRIVHAEFSQIVELD